VSTSFWLYAIDSVLIATAVAAYLDSRRMHRLLAQARHDADHDPLTGLANRRLIDSTLRHALTTSGPVSVVLLDLDLFKEINDVYGHAAGDAVLREVARRLDRAHPAIRVAGRLGGDEFILLVGGNAAVAVDVANLVWQAVVRRPLRIAGRDLAVRISAGTATTAPGVGAAELLHRADLALYRAKVHGPVAAYSPDDRRMPVEARPRQRLRDRHRIPPATTTHHAAAVSRPVGPAAAQMRYWFPLDQVAPLVGHVLQATHHRRTFIEEHLIQSCPGALELITDGIDATLASSGLPALTADPGDNRTEVTAAAARIDTPRRARHRHRTDRRPADVHHLHLDDPGLTAALRAPASAGLYLVVVVDGDTATGHITADTAPRPH
jgi:diguanylate cyclase (GGDEF)-like protein